MIDAEVARDGVRPGRELRFVFERARALDDPQKYLLRQILRRGRRLDLTKHEIEERRFVPLDEYGERTEVAPLVAGHQRFVRYLGPRGAFHGLDL